MTDASADVRWLPLVPAPDSALTWQSAPRRREALKQWRHAVFAAFGEQARCIRTAWVLAGLFHAERGYAYPSDQYLAKETGLPVNKVQETLTRLDRGGAILRVHHPLGKGKTQRLIYPARTLIPPTSGGALPPTSGVWSYPPAIGGT